MRIVVNTKEVIKDTFYRERRGKSWSYWTYSDGNRIVVSEWLVLRSLKQGDRLITVK